MITTVLNGKHSAQFVINGKHVRTRRRWKSSSTSSESADIENNLLWARELHHDQDRNTNGKQMEDERNERIRDIKHHHYRPSTT
ncbi:hypothetical protein Sjap_026315 [Stephania japonica]|uniref:Uncharacterized protein n=1 Tax=Stephania japonica TaxID=461633 RepID=A0AAP0HGC6_9MAGN